MKYSPSALPVILALFTVARLSAANDWNQWRGPNRDGICKSFRAPTTWPTDAMVRKWTLPVGEGHSSPVISGDHVYVFAREGDNEVMRCIALTDGKVAWQESSAAPYEMNPAARGHGKGPKSTPTVAGGRVFALGINGQFSAWDAAKGTVLWRKNFAGSFRATAPVFGASTSPIVDGSNVIIHVGGDDNGALTAFDVATGKVNWKWDGDGPAYASPIIATLGGVRQLVTQTQKHCLALSPADGKLLWKIPFTTPYDQNSVTPVVVGDLVVFGGVQKSMFAVKVSGTDAQQAWETNEVAVYMSTPVVNGTTLYGMSTKQRGSLFVMNGRSGEVLWKGEGRLGENASLTDVGPVLLVVTDGGDLIVEEKAASSLKEVARYKVANSPVWASPAFAGDQVLIKDKTHLTLYRLGPKS